MEDLGGREAMGQAWDVPPARTQPHGHTRCGGGWKWGLGRTECGFSEQPASLCTGVRV